MACYFVVDGSIGEDSVIYTYQNQSYIDVEKHPDPLRYNNVGKFIPKHITPRITTQGGLFTVHPNAYETFTSEDMDKIIIPNEIRSTLKKTINKYGVDQFSLFPGLDGLAAHVEWLQSKRD